MGPRAASKALAEARKRPDTPCCYLRFYGRLVSLWCRPITGRCVMRSCIVRPFVGLPSSAPPWRARGAVHVGGGLVVRPLARRFQQSLRLSFPVKRGSSGPWVSLHRCLVASTSEARVNLATPLCVRPLSVTDAPPLCPATAAAPGGSPCHYLLCGSDRAGVCPAQVSAVPHSRMGDPSQTLPLARLSRGGPTGDLQPPHPCPCGSKGRSRLPPAFAVFGLGSLAPSDERSALSPSHSNRNRSPSASSGE